MREILFRGKDIYGKWLYGDLINLTNEIKQICNHTQHEHAHSVDIKTVGQYTGLTDKNGRRIFEGDIIQYLTFDDFDCQSIVKFGEYKQDGSGGEYKARDCIGFYAEVNNFTCPDWCENEPDCFSDYLKQQNILEVAKECEVIGNIYDNPELIKGAGQ